MGPAPATSNVFWKTNITGIEPYIVAFNGKIFVCTTTGVAAVDQAGQIVWQKNIPMNGTRPVPYKIDNSHLIVEGTCLDPQNGSILWTSTQFSADTGVLFVANVYSPEEKMFYVKVGSYINAWDFSDPSVLQLSLGKLMFQVAGQLVQESLMAAEWCFLDLLRITKWHLMPKQAKLYGIL